MNTQSNFNAGSGCLDTSCSASPEAVQYADYILNHYSRNSHADKLCLARDLERHGWKKNSPVHPPQVGCDESSDHDSHDEQTYDERP